MKIRVPFLTFLFLLIVCECNANLIFYSGKGDSTKTAIKKNYLDSTKRVGFVSYKNDIGVECAITTKSKSYYFESNDQGDTSAKGYDINAFENAFTSIYTGIQYQGISFGAYFLNQKAYVNQKAYETLEGKSSGFSFGVPIKRFHLNFALDKSFIRYPNENRSVNSKSIHPRLLYRPFKSKYVNSMQNSVNNQVRSAFAFDLLAHYNYFIYSRYNENDSIFTHEYRSTRSLNLHEVGSISGFGFSLSARLSANLVLFRTLFFNLVVEGGTGFGKMKLKSNSLLETKGEITPNNNCATVGMGLMLKRFVIKFYVKTSGVTFDGDFFVRGNRANLSIKDDYLNLFFGISYRIKEPKKIEQAREKILNRAKIKMNSLISGD